MALDGNALGTVIAATIEANKPDPDVKITAAELETMWKAIATDIVNHFVANTVVSTSVATVVTTPDTINGTGTGSGTGTIA